LARREIAVTKPNPLESLPFLADPKREAEDVRLQEIRKASFGRGRLTEEERLVSRGLALEEIALANLESQLTVREQGNNRRAKGGATEKMVEEEEARLAEALAMTGRYREAADTHPQKAMAKHYEAIAEAIERDDDEECDCPPMKKRKMKDGREIEVPRRHIAQRVFSPVHGRLVELESCTTCAHMNARPARGVLAAALVAQEANRGAAMANREALAKGQRPTARLINDGGVLRNG
jgi:hypothetical protein